jgi:cytochrome c peroxidase
MHDGSIATLEEALDHYARGGRQVTEGPHAGDGSKSPLRDVLLRPFDMTAEERADIVEFLKSLTDEAFLTDPRFSNPWPDAEP